jgi:hypothetical protein
MEMTLASIQIIPITVVYPSYYVVFLEGVLTQKDNSSNLVFTKLTPNQSYLQKKILDFFTQGAVSEQYLRVYRLEK